ncbi:response regulator [Melaminivora sp.]|uniref:hybrid sensor histidine kinase/response regulator n=1 Tax=Melaminivora sp. TaxID=1933032 RepID=UPI0028ABF285|nr:response regulator [Melaminivora sp.]
MTGTQDHPAHPAADDAPAAGDLGPLAWAHASLREALQAAADGLQRFADGGRGAAGAAPLGQALRQLQQARGVLDMVDMAPAARFAAALEGAVQHLQDLAAQGMPEAREHAAALVQGASALLDHLDQVLAGSAISPVALFPHYRLARQLAGGAAAHPADLWSGAQPTTPPLPASAEPLAYGREPRARLDSAVLRLVKEGRPEVAAELRALCLGFAAARQEPEVRSFWQICAGFFDALAQGALALDVYARRAAPRVLLQYAALAQGGTKVNDKLVQELLFFCAQAGPVEPGQAPALAAVRQAHALRQHTAVDYERPSLELPDQAAAGQARAQLAAAAEAWAVTVAGQGGAVQGLADRLDHAAPLLARVLPGNGALVQAVVRVVQGAVALGAPPGAALALEVATALLYLQALLDEPVALASDEEAARARSLAQRLDAVAAGGEPAPAGAWLQALQRGPGEYRGMDAVLDALRGTLAQVQAGVEQYLAKPAAPEALAQAALQLRQAQGVLTLLELESAGRAVEHMATLIARLQAGAAEPGRSAALDGLGRNLAALDALFDMLGYQPALARRLFVYDAGRAELRRQEVEPPEADAPPPTPAPPLPPPGAPDADAGAETETDAAEPLPQPSPDEAVKVIGALRVPLPLYNDFLNQADEWSRQLLVVLQEWALELHCPLPAQARELAEVLAEGAAAVGFEALAQLAALLARALQLRQGCAGTPAQAQVLDTAAQDLRRLLHQFAAGFLKPPQPRVLAQLQALVAEGATPGQEAPDPELLAIFEDEALDLLPRLGAALRQWQASPGELQPRAEALRVLHTLKGSARLAGAQELGLLAHELESEAGQLAQDARPQDIDRLLAGLDALQAAFDALRAECGTQPAVPQPESRPEPIAPATPAVPEESLAVAPEALQASEARTSAPGEDAAERAAPPAPPSVRVRAHVLDRLVQQAGEVLATRTRLQERLTQMRGAVEDLAQIGERPSPDAHAALADAREALQQALQAAEDDLALQGRQARELQRGLLRARRVEFDSVAERLHALVRQVAREAGRQAQLTISGGDVPWDRALLERMVPVLEHLLRNCVVHGIEAPQARTAAGKSAQGRIGIELQQDDHALQLRVQDDGAGLDEEALRARAIAQGLIESDAEPGPEGLAELVCTPGLSTSAEVTGLSGRGIGMDVVRAELRALGGRLAIRSQRGQGTTFELELPLAGSQACQVLLLRAGAQTFGVPAALVAAVRRCSRAELEQAYAGHGVVHEGRALPLYWAGALLQSSPRSSEPAGRALPVLVLRRGAQRIALHVDEVLGTQDAALGSLGPQLSRLPGLVGLAALASGEPALIYDPLALATEDPPPPGAAAPAAAPACAPAEAAQPAPLLLVVDDSDTARRAAARLLERAGYRVALAASGREALQRLHEEPAAVVLTDLEMPDMDGFGLLGALRLDPALQAVPVLMVSSRTAPEHRERALALGAQHYLAKPYHEDELLALVRQCLRRAMAVRDKP